MGGQLPPSTHSLHLVDPKVAPALFVTKSGAALATRSPKMQANLESARKPSLAARVADESVTERSMHVHGSYATIHGDLVWGDLWEICGRSWEIWGDIYACMDRTLQYTEI